MQKLLLGNYTDVEAFNRARKLHISSSARRAVFLVETRQSKDEHALATIKIYFLHARMISSLLSIIVALSSSVN